MREVSSVLLVEPNSLFREGLCRILRTAHFRIANSVSSIDPALLESVADSANLLLVIGAGKDHHTAVKQIELFKEKCAAGRVAVVADCYQPSDILAAFKAGANAYFLQSTVCEAFIRSLDLIMLGQTLIPAEILPSFISRADDAPGRINDAPADAAPAIERARTPHLSAQEKRILQHLIEGDSNKTIARKIDIAEATVKVHIKAILRKIQVHNRTQAAIWAMHNNSENAVFAKQIGNKNGFSAL